MHVLRRNGIVFGIFVGGEDQSNFDMTYSGLEMNGAGWVGVSQLCDNGRHKASDLIKMASKRQLQRGERMLLKKKLTKRHDSDRVPSILLPSFSHLIIEKASCLFDGVEEPCDVTSGDVFVG